MVCVLQVDLGLFFKKNLLHTKCTIVELILASSGIVERSLDV